MQNRNTEVRIYGENKKMLWQYCTTLYLVLHNSWLENKLLDSDQKARVIVLVFLQCACKVQHLHAKNHRGDRITIFGGSILFPDPQ
jgi:hypothetical protein